MIECLIGLGANLGRPREAILSAAARLEDHPAVSDVQLSGLHEFAAIGGPAGQPPFLNAAAKLETSLTAVKLLGLLQSIENELGRQRGERWAARTLDLDLLLFGDEVVRTEQLAVPHPRMAFRYFVLRPANDIAGEMRHPEIGWTVSQLHDHLVDTPDYVAVAGEKASVAGELALWLAKKWPADLVQRDVTDEFAAPRVDDGEPSTSQLCRSAAGIGPRGPIDPPLVTDHWWPLEFGMFNCDLLSPDVSEQFEKAVADLPRPKLLAIIPSELALALAARFHQGPLLRLPSDKADAKEELLAAVRAMQPG